jgi:integrase
MGRKVRIESDDVLIIRTAPIFQPLLAPARYKDSAQRLAINLLRTMPRMAGHPYVIAGKNPGARLINLQKPWRRIRAKANLADVRIHDLRHSFASVAASSGTKAASQVVVHRQEGR